MSDADYISKSLANKGYDLIIGGVNDKGMFGKIINNFINKIYVSDDGSIDIMLKYDSQYENAIKALNYAK